MPSKKQQVKHENRVPKISSVKRNGRLKETELSAYGRAKHTIDASQVDSLCDSQSRREELLSTSQEVEKRNVSSTLWVPVVSKTGTPLMPCHPARARKLVRNNKAIRRFKEGLFYIQLTEREEGEVQEVSCGIDSGSKREAFTVKSEKNTFINILSDAITIVKDKIETRRMMRRSRRNRKTPYRKNRLNRKHNKNFIAPSTKARWQAKLRIVNILRKLSPIEYYVVEDIKAISKKGKKGWNQSFSPLEYGKNWFYNQIKKFGELILKQGYETAKMRKDLGLIKTKEKLEEVFSAHNVDSWVLSNSAFNNFQKYPDNKRMYKFISTIFIRRQLHVLKPIKNGIRKNVGGTIHLDIIKGTVVKHKKYGLVYVGGSSKNRISIHNINTGERLAQNIKVEDVEELFKLKWRVQFLPA